MNPLLEVRGITKSFQRLLALDDVSFNVGAGEIVGLIGPNGAGKSTLIGVLSGAIKPDNGSITYAGKVITGLSAFRVGKLGIARTFQLAQPFYHLTAIECVMLGLLFGSDNGRCAQVSDARERARSILDSVGLSGKGNLPAEQLNIPERKRLEIARSIAARPQLLLLDEVMAGLSTSEIRDIISLIKSIRHQGISVIVIEHVMHAIKNLADRVVALHHGKKIAEGPAEEVIGNRSIQLHYLGRAPSL